MLRFIFTIFAVAIVFVSSSFVVDRSGKGELVLADDLAFAPYTKTFTITAYYSPLPCQQRYATGSYEGDIRLNGNGTNGADGTEVYPGMVAAPKSYAFGTKMNIPGIGIVAVHDRGGAIVASSGTNGVFDRLDVWMGFGDTGLKRALGWGKRNVDVTVYGLTDAVDENMTLMGFSESESIPGECGQPNENTDEQPEVEQSKPVVPPVEAPAVPTLPVEKPQPVATKVAEKAVNYFLEKDLRLGDSGESVIALQEKLRDLNLFRAEITGFYGEVTAHAVFKFQQINGLVLEKDSQFAGVFGAKTRAKLNEISASKLYFSKKLVKAEVDVVAPKSGSVALFYGVTDKAVTDLQLFLREKGFFKGAFLTEYFGPVTRDAVIAFQLNQNIITSANDESAGVVGPATLEAIRKLTE